MADPIEFDSPALQWGADASYNVQGDARDGTPVKVPPGLGLIRQGARPGRQQAAQYLNWVMNHMGAAVRGLVAGLRANERHTYLEFLANGTFTVPANTTLAMIEGCGGGGCGGPGAANPGGGAIATGGGGGGGAVLAFRFVQLVPGEVYQVVVGAGGLWGGTPESASGQDTTITRVSTGEVVFRAPGAGYGLNGVQVGNDGVRSAWALGGAPVRLGPYNAGDVGGAMRPLELPIVCTVVSVPQAGFLSYIDWPVGGMPRDATPGRGANGVKGDSGTYGGHPAVNANGSATGFYGGRNGLPNLGAQSSYRGGGGGGGGGGGAFGNGGAGGGIPGGGANSSGAAGNGTAGANAAPNSGAGGGGGQGGGGGPSGGNAGASGQGGSGRCRIVLSKPFFVAP